MKELLQRQTFSLGTLTCRSGFAKDTPDGISVEFPLLEHSTLGLSKSLTKLARSGWGGAAAAAAHFLVLESKMSCLLSNVLAAPSETERGLETEVDCSVVKSAESCLACGSGCLMNIVGLVVVVVAAEQKEKVD